MPKDGLLVWMDLEMTSVADVKKDSIISIATVITDDELNIIAEQPELIIKTDMSRFAEIPSEVLAIHEKSGILESLQHANLSLQEAEEQVINFLAQYVKQGSSPLCGNSVHQDRYFIKFHMPRIDNFLHYRHIDVSTIKELVRRWYPDIYNKSEQIKGPKIHRAMEDIKSSIRELKFYKEHWLKLLYNNKKHEIL